MPEFSGKHHMGRHVRVLLFLLVSVCFLSACGFTTTHRANGASESKLSKPIAIPLFSNATLEPILEKEMTRIFKETFYAQGWQVTNSQKGDEPLLSGRVTYFSVVATALTLTGGAREYQMRIGLEVHLLQGAGAEQKKIFTTTVEGISDYRAQPDSATERAAKNRAIREAGQEMAEQVSAFLRLPAGKAE